LIEVPAAARLPFSKTIFDERIIGARAQDAGKRIPHAFSLPPALAGVTVTVATVEFATGQPPLCTTAR